MCCLGIRHTAFPIPESLAFSKARGMVFFPSRSLFEDVLSLVRQIPPGKTEVYRNLHNQKMKAEVFSFDSISPLGKLLWSHIPKAESHRAESDGQGQTGSKLGF